jgi:hypothetical protein
MGDIQIAFCNVRGWFSAELEVRAFLRRARVDILAIAEHHLSGGQGISVPGYQWFGKNSPVSPRARRGNGGVGFLVADRIAHLVVPEPCGGPRRMWLRLASPRGHTSNDVYLAVVYGHQETADPRVVNTEFAGLTHEVARFRRRGGVLLTGDFNARTGKLLGPAGESKVSRNGRKLFAFTDSQDLMAPSVAEGMDAGGTPFTHSQPMAGGRVTSSIIDYLLADSVTASRMVGVRTWSGEEAQILSSDHYVLSFALRESFLPPPKRARSKPSLRVGKLRADSRSFKRAFARAFLDWEAVVARIRRSSAGSRAVESVWTAFSHRLWAAANKAVGVSPESLVERRSGGRLQGPEGSLQAMVCG